MRDYITSYINFMFYLVSISDSSGNVSREDILTSAFSEVQIFLQSNSTFREIFVSNNVIL